MLPFRQRVFSALLSGLAVLPQAIAPAGMMYCCCAVTPRDCCDNSTQAVQKPACSCCNSEATSPAACCTPTQSGKKPCTCWLGKASKEAALPSANSVREAPDGMSPPAAALPVSAFLPAVCVARRIELSAPIPPRFRLQSLYCIWTI